MEMEMVAAAAAAELAVTWTAVQVAAVEVEEIRALYDRSCKDILINGFYNAHECYSVKLGQLL